MREIREHRFSSAWWLYICGAALLVTGYYVVPALVGEPEWIPRLAFYGTVSLSAAVALLVGLRVNRPAYRLPWLLFAAGQLVYFAADLTFYGYHYLLENFMFPAPADALYLIHYPLYIVPLWLLVRSRSGRDRSSLIDGLILGTAGALLSWIFLVHPNATSAGISNLVAGVTVTFPFFMDVILLVLTVRLVTGPGRRSPAYLLLCASTLFLIFSDSTFGWMILHGGYTVPNFLDATWVAYYVLLGAAALHPSMARLAEPARAERPILTPRRLAWLTGAALVAPAVLLVHGFQEQGSEPDHIAVAVASILLFGLVILRLADLMRAQRVTEQERSRLLERTMEIGEQERSRLAMDLHDGPIQALASLGYTLDRTTMRLERGDVTGGLDIARRLRARLDEEICGLRRLMSELRPSALDERGLEAALSELAIEFERRTGISCAFEGGSNNGRLAADLETVLYRVTQEALTNAAKHSNAARVRIALSRRNGSLELSVCDDGEGFVRTRRGELVRAGHFGLVGMNERVERAGGEWELSTFPGEGTTINARVPLPSAALAGNGAGSASGVAR